MAEAKQGDTVKVHYTGKLDDGRVFDSSVEREPLEFTVGSGQVIPGFDTAVEGLDVGEATTTTIPADEAYGPYRDELVMNVENSQLPEGMEPQVGQRLQGQQGEQTIVFTVTAIEENGVTLDANHPLAGKDLTFEIQLMEVA